MEGGAFQSKKLAKASLDYKFVFLHQTAEDSVPSYKLVTEEYLEEDFSKVVGEIELTSLVSRMSLDRHEETGELIDLAISAPCQS